MTKLAYTVLHLILYVFVAGYVYASSIQLPQSTLYPFQNSVEVSEEFLNGTQASGAIGALGWAIDGGSANGQPGVASHPGLQRIDTSAVINTQPDLFLASSISNMVPTDNHRVMWVGRLNTNDGNTTMRHGMNDQVTTNPPTNGIYIEKLDADTNYFCVTRNAAVQTRVDSGAAVNTNFHNMGYTRNTSGVQFVINGVNVCGLINTNIPTVAIRPVFTLINSAAANKTYDLDYFSLSIFGISR